MKRKPYLSMTEDERSVALVAIDRKIKRTRAKVAKAYLLADKLAVLAAVKVLETQRYEMRKNYYAEVVTQ